MTYYAELNQKKIKKFPAKNLDSAFKQYNDYCRNRIPHARLEKDESSIGFMSWQNDEKILKLVKED